MKKLILRLMATCFFVFSVGTVYADQTVTYDSPKTNPCAVTDTAPPEVVVSEMLEIWPPNHKYHQFNLSDLAVTAQDDCTGTLDPDISGTIISIYSDEPEDAAGNGDGKTHDNIVILGPSSFEVRAERQGKGNGRVYGIIFEVRDGNGNATVVTGTLGVPHDNSGDPPADDGPDAGYSQISKYVVPTIEFNSDHEEIEIGNSATLSWNTADAETCTIEPDIGTVELNGTIQVFPAVTTTYTITATGNDRTSTATITIVVTTLPVIPTIEFATDHDAIENGNSATLSWNTADADTCTIEPDIGTVDLSGSIQVFPAVTTTYTITASGPGGTSTATVTITVTAVGIPTIEFTTDHDAIEFGNSATLSWNMTGSYIGVLQPDIGIISPNGTIQVSPSVTTTYTITAIGQGGMSTASVTISVSGVVIPTIEFNTDLETIEIGNTATLSWSTTDAYMCTIEPDIGTVDLNGAIQVSPSVTTTYTITATGHGGATTATVTIAVNAPNNTPPSVNITPASESIEQGEAITLSWSSQWAGIAFIDNGVGGVPVNGSTTVSPGYNTTYTITVTGPGGSASAQAVIKVSGNPSPQPEGAYGEMYSDLIPSDATVEAYDSKRFSLISGHVEALDGIPIPGVSVNIHNRPEYGTATTDGNGRFVIPVEGGGTITVTYKKEGLITSHRTVYVPWNDIAICETITMIAEDSASTIVEFNGDPNTVVTHISTEVTDLFGSRSFSMVFTGDNQAYLVDENGNDVQELSTITTRATEYTTPESMPAKLPPNSAYTYCVELGVDGAQRVRFEKPVITWVDNFLGFDVGEPVPVGYYDRDRGVWVPSENGAVVMLLDTDGDGVTDALDADGDDQPDDLNDNGAFTDEVTGLDDPTIYLPGTTFWRVAITHFTPWDCNWPYGPPLDAPPPNPDGIPHADQQKTKNQDDRRCVSSYAEERSRIFHEDIPIPGTDMTLHYASNRVEGYRTYITVPASGESVPDNLKKIIVQLNVAGRILKQDLAPLPNQKAEFVWDGLDLLGRRVNGPTTAHVSVGFVYNVVYYSARVEWAQAFGQAGNDVTGIRGRRDITLWKRTDIVVYDIPRTGKITLAEGWSLSTHHAMSLVDSSILFKGDGATIKGGDNVITTVAGNGTWGVGGDGGPATEAQMTYIAGVAVDPGGNLYIANSSSNRIRKVDPSGIITTVAGNSTQGGYSGDGGPATEANLYVPVGVAVDPSGNLYIAERDNYRIRKVDPSGIITTVAGNGTQGYGGDGGPATEANLGSPRGVAVDPSGNIYIADSGNQRIRKVDPSGIITTVAGNGTRGYSGDGGPATEANLYGPQGVAVDPSGNLYIGDSGNYRIRKVDPSGIITTVAGNGTRGYSGDGGPATEAQMKYTAGVAVDPGGNLYIADSGNRRIRKVDPSGIITTVAGNGTRGYSGDGGPANEAKLYGPQGVAVDPSGNIYTAGGPTALASRIRKVFREYEFGETVDVDDIPVADLNGRGYIMSPSGLHKKTIDLNSGAVLLEFGYDTDNNLINIINRFGNTIIIERDGTGTPTAIVSPDGLRTRLDIDVVNHLTGVILPDNSQYAFTYSDGGLMIAEIEPNGNRFDHSFDEGGRLTDIYDQEGGHWNFARVAFENGDIQSEVTAGEGNLTSYLDHTYSTGAYSSTTTDSTGAQTLFSQSSDGLTSSSSLPCGMDLEFNYDLDAEYKFKFVKRMTESTPSGLKQITLRDKIYADTDSDEIPDLITETVTVNGKAATLEDNVLQSQKTATTPEGRTVTSLYDPATLLTTSVSLPGLFDTTYGYDPNGRLTSVTRGTRETNFAHNAQGFLESVTAPEGHTTTYTHDPVGRVTGINRPDGTLVEFSYDPNGNMTLLTNPATIDHGFDFNKVNKNSSYQTPISGGYSYAYDKDRRLTQTTFPSGKQIINVYDKTRLAQILTPEGNIDFTYLCSSKVESITNGADSVTYGYDGKLVTSEAMAGNLNQTLSYTYNNDFNPIGFTYAGDTAGYTYDNDGLLTGAGSFAITRNAQNGLPDAVADGSMGLARTFNGYGETDSQSLDVSGQNLSSWALVRDNNGRITGKTETVSDTPSDYIYEYDSMGRLLNVVKDGITVEAYQYNANGIRTYEMNALRGIAGRTFTYSDEDHLLTAGDTVYQYNFDSFLLSKTNGTDNTEYNYSTRGELLDVLLPDGRSIAYAHDPLGRRIAKRVDGVTTEKYLWQGLTRLLAVYDGNDNLLMRFRYADDRVPPAMTRDGVTYYLAYDQVGSLRVVADASGNVVKKIDYDAFGNVIADTDPAFEIPFGFAGGLHDRDTGLI